MGDLFSYTRLQEHAVSVLPWYNGERSVKGDPRKTVKWIDGLRGIASFLVLVTHICRSFDYELFSPRDDPDLPPRLMQRVILRVPWQGRLGVTIFGFLTGYVCALKPMKQARAGDSYGAFITVAKSAFRRPPRLILPATIAMCISWTIAQFGAYTMANRCDSNWMRDAAPDLEDTLWKEVIHLMQNFSIAWTNTAFWIHMVYDEHQWALLPLLRASMVIYIVSVATILCKYRWRLLICICLLLYYYQDGQLDRETFEVQALYGMILSDLSYEAGFKSFLQNSSYRWIRRIAAWTMLVAGLYVCSYPTENPEWADWSLRLKEWGDYVFPEGSNYPKRWSAVGVDLIIMSIFLTNWSKEFLSSRLLLWLGKQSFAVYLLHGMLLRTVLVWMIYGTKSEPWVWTVDDQGMSVPPEWIPRRGPWVFAVSIPCWLVMVYVCATLWTNYVDPFCARITQRLENACVEQDSEKISRPMP